MSPEGQEPTAVAPGLDPLDERHQEFVGALQALGGSAGNGKLRDLLGWEEEEYEAVRAALLASGLVVSGRGRGGSVSLTGNGSPREYSSARRAPAAPQAPGPQPTGKQNLSAFIWGVADLLRGDYKQSDYGKVILPFTVLRRLDCVLEPTKEAVLAEKTVREGQGLDPEPFLLRKAGQNFCNTSPLDMKRLMGDQDNIGENLRSYIQAFTPEVRDIFERFEFHLQVDRLEKSGLLYLIAERFAQIDLHPETVSNAEMGLVFEELIRKFAELSNETAGEHFTPREVIRLMVNLIFIEDNDVLTKPGVVRTLYDPTGGTGGMLSVGEEHLLALNPLARLVMYGQELNPESYAICKADMLIKGQDIRNIVFGNTLSDDGLQGLFFDYMLSNPPFGVDWKKIEKFIRNEAEKLGYAGRFGPGLPRVSDGSLLFLLHLISKMRPAKDGGSRFGIVLNGSPLFTGGAGSGESEIRRYVLENDLVEAIIGLPTDMFYNTGISTYVWILSNRKPEERKGKVQLIDASSSWQKMRKSLGSKRKEMSAEHIEEITRLFGAFEEAEKDGKPISKIFRNEDFGYRTITVERPLRDEDDKVVISQRGKAKDRPTDNKRIKECLNVPLLENIEVFFQRKILDRFPDASVSKENSIVGYEIPFRRTFDSIYILRQISALETQYKTFRQYTIDEITQSVSIEKITHATQSTYTSEDESVGNYLYIRSLLSGDTQVSATPFISPNTGDVIFSILLGQDACGEFLELFFRSPLGRLSWEIECPKPEPQRLTTPQPRWENIRDICFPLPSIAQQHEIINTLHKLESLKQAIDLFEVGLSVDPIGSRSALKQLDSMLLTLNELSESDRIRGLVREGESKSLEFKQTLSLDVSKRTKEKYIEDSALKTVAAFLNTDGGTLLIGVSDSGEIVGIEEEVKKLYKSQDSFLLHWKNLLKNRIGEQFYPFIDAGISSDGAVAVMAVSCKQSPVPCFLDGRDFYVRTNPATDKLEGEKLVSYVKNRFR